MPAAPADLPAGVILVVGDEEFLVSRALERIAAARRRADPTADVIDCEGSDVVAAELWELLSPSLFGGMRTVIIRSAQDILAAATPAVTAFVKDPGEDITLVLQHAGGAKGKALLETTRQAAHTVISCAKLTRPEERADFIRGEVKRAGAAITPDAAAYLLEAVGSDLRELAMVTAQLASDSGGRIDARTVAAYHTGRAEVTGFAVSDRAVIGDTAGAVETLRWAMSIGVPPVLIADALADGIRSVARVSAAGRGDPNRMAAALGMPPWKIRRAQGQARGWSEPGLRRAMQAVADLNADVKGAAVDPIYALERTIRVLAEARAAR